MELRRHPDPAEFATSVGGWLTQERARHNMVLGVTGTLVERPEVYERFHLWSVRGPAGAVAAAAVVTPPFRLLLADATSPAAVECLAAGIHADLGAIPGTVANLPTSGWFVDAWTARTGTTATRTLAQGVFELERVEPVPHAAGGPAPAGAHQLDELLPWLMAFQAEAHPHLTDDPDEARRLLGLRLDEHAGSGIWVWVVDGAPAAMCGFTTFPPDGARIGPVYTPPEHRGRGYATALVAAQSEWLLAGGRSRCYLYTDLTNPVSNAIYRRIGYRQVAESAEHHFTGAA